MTNNSEARTEKRATETILKRKAKKARKLADDETLVLFAAIYDKQVQQEDGSYETEEEEVAYRIPKKISPSTSLRLMRTLRKFGEPVMIAEMLEELLGEEGYEALLDLDLNDDDMATITKRAWEIVFGPVEEAVKN